MAKGFLTCGGEVTTSVTVNSSGARIRSACRTPRCRCSRKATCAAAIMGRAVRVAAHRARRALSAVAPERDGEALDDSPSTADVAPTPPTNVTVNVDLNGSGSGTVTSSPSRRELHGRGRDDVRGQFHGQPIGDVDGHGGERIDVPGVEWRVFGHRGRARRRQRTRSWSWRSSTRRRPTITVYYHQDLIGSVRAVTDALGNLSTAARHDYLVFGEEFGQAQPSGAPLSAETERFGGKEVDAETFLQNFGARYLDGLTGRFRQVDPVLSESARTWRRRRGIDTRMFERPAAVCRPDGHGVRRQGLPTSRLHSSR